MSCSDEHVSHSTDNLIQITPQLKARLQKAKYGVYNHSAVELCHWTKKSFANEGNCYKHKFYGISTHQCMEMTPTAMNCENRCIYCWRPTEFYDTLEMPEELVDEPDMIVHQLMAERKKLINGFYGHAKNDKKKLDESLLLYDEFGNIKDERHFDNLIVDAGFEGVAYRIAPHDGNSVSSPWNYIAIGTGSTAPAAGDTALAGSELVRLQDTEATYTSTPSKQLELEASFGPGIGTGNVAESGLFNAVSGGDMLARQTFTSISKGASDTLTVTWTITLSST